MHSICYKQKCTVASFNLAHPVYRVNCAIKTNSKTTGEGYHCSSVRRNYGSLNSSTRGPAIAENSRSYLLLYSFKRKSVFNAWLPYDYSPISHRMS